MHLQIHFLFSTAHVRELTHPKVDDIHHQWMISKIRYDINFPSIPTLFIILPLPSLSWCVPPQYDTSNDLTSIWTAQERCSVIWYNSALKS